MAALTQHYGQPHQLALQQITKLMDGYNLSSGDVKASKTCALNVYPFVNMLEQLGTEGEVKMECGSHVGNRKTCPC